MKRACFTVLLCIVFGTPIVFCQLSIREWHTSSWKIASLVSLDTGGRILAVANQGRALLSADGGSTFVNAVTTDQYFRLGDYARIGADGNANGIITGSKVTKLQLITSNGGENWQEKEFIALNPEGRNEIPIWRDGNSHLSLVYVSADAGLSWRKIEIPDTIGFFDPAQVPFGYSYGRGILMRPSALTPWYQVNHSTGKMTERRDIPSAAYLAHELANGASIRAFFPPNAVRFEACYPDSGCISLDSTSAATSLRGFQVDRTEHCNDFAVLSFIEKPLAIVLRSTAPQVVDVREYDTSATVIRRFACGPRGVAFQTDNSFVFVSSSGNQTSVVMRKVPSLQNMILADMKVIGVLSSQVFVVVDLETGLVSVGGQRREEEGTDRYDGFSDVYPTVGGAIGFQDRGTVLSAESDKNGSLLFLADGVMFTPSVVNPLEIAESAQRRQQAVFGASRFAQMSEHITASGGPRGLRLEFHNGHTTKQSRADTITFVSSLNAGSRLIAGCRSLFSSLDLGTTWQEVPTPKVGSAISSYIEDGETQLLGYRGFDVTVNGVPASPILGGLYRKSSDGEWTRENAIQDNYVVSVQTDSNGEIWAVTTNAVLEYTTDEDGSGTGAVVTQIDVGQSDIHIWRSTDRGVTWQVVHTELASGGFEPITGAVTSTSNGHLIAMPRRLLWLPRGNTQFLPIDALPFGVRARSARLDAQNRAWVAASNGLYLVDINGAVSVEAEPTEFSSNLSIAPNPVSPGRIVTISSGGETVFEGLVYDVMGRVVSRVVDGTLLTYGLSAGSYFVRSVNGKSALLTIAN